MLETAHIVSGPTGFAEKPLPALHAERSRTRTGAAQLDHPAVGCQALAPAGDRNPARHRHDARHHGCHSVPGLLWLPGDHEGTLEVEAGAQGYLISVSDDVLTRTVAGSAEALHLRRTIDRLVLREGAQLATTFAAITGSCSTLVRELNTPGRGSATMTSTHVLLLCLHLWRSVISEEAPDDAAQRGDGPRLVGNFLQMVELHYRDGWPIARYAAALGVTDDKLHAHCKREKVTARAPSCISA